MSLLLFFARPDFWIAYGIVGILSMGAFFQLITYHQWFHGYDPFDYADIPKPLAHIVVSLTHAVLWPITWSTYATFLFAWGIRHLYERVGKIGKDASPPIRCNHCMSLIRVTDSYCPLCGADQSELGKHS